MDTEKRNYQKELDALIRGYGGRRPHVLLHSCCGPCSSAVLEYLTQYFDITLLWYNPNLYPESEFTRRLATQRQLIACLGLTDRVRLIAEDWRQEDYLPAVRGLEQEPEGGARCAVCFRVRLTEAAKTARRLGCDYFCSTLTLSRYKNAPLINAIGEEIAAEVGIPWLPSDFKKQGREMRSSELSKTFGLYQQNYCGCEYSLENRRAWEKAHASEA